jgi:hypothetical protein
LISRSWAAKKSLTGYTVHLAFSSGRMTEPVASAARYQFVGSVSKDSFSADAFRQLNPRGLLAGSVVQDRLIDNRWELSPQTAKYNRWTNNFHSHRTAILSSLEFE